MSTTTLTLTEFLLARIAEDEAQAARRFDEWRGSGGTLDLVLTLGPARVKAECEAKRRIVESLDAHLGNAERYPDAYPGMVALADWHVRVLAAIYADHPDYLEEWKP